MHTFIMCGAALWWESYFVHVTEASARRGCGVTASYSHVS